MTFAWWQNHLTTHFSEHIPVIKRHISVYTRRPRAYVLKNQLHSCKSSLTRAFKTGARMAYRVWAGQLWNHGLFLAKARYSCLQQNFQASSMNQPASFQWAPVDQSLAGSQKGSAEVHSPPSGAKVKDERNYTVIFFNKFLLCTKKKIYCFYTKMQNYRGSNPQRRLKNCFIVIYYEQNWK
jgi:hypothetical protein